jgi:hypothetical protein
VSTNLHSTTAAAAPSSHHQRHHITCARDMPAAAARPVLTHHAGPTVTCRWWGVHRMGQMGCRVGLVGCASDGANAAAAALSLLCRTSLQKSTAISTLSSEGFSSSRISISRANTCGHSTAQHTVRQHDAYTVPAGPVPTHLMQQPTHLMQQPLGHQVRQEICCTGLQTSWVLPVALTCAD